MRPTPDLLFTKHALDVMAERRIGEELIAETVTSPDRVERRPDGTTHYIRAFRQCGSRFLRVVTVEGERHLKVVTVFFDRRLRRRHAN
ncbi:DUF4258 domain-containing protein [Geochorda subterranea]|uniref:DUF4258 domain-containing protein n=1 Tax=Geochorda subterranea TaxID=3109564 RepID=UPI0038602CD9